MVGWIGCYKIQTIHILGGDTHIPPHYSSFEREKLSATNPNEQICRHQYQIAPNVQAVSNTWIQILWFYIPSPNKFWKAPPEGPRNYAKMVWPLWFGLVDQRKVDRLTGLEPWSTMKSPPPPHASESQTGSPPPGPRCGSTSLYYISLYLGWEI